MNKAEPIIDRDLTQQAPRSPRARIAGFVIASRAADKCRASLAGTPGEYHYDCPLDKMLFTFKGITAEQFKAAVKVSTTYDEIGAWLLANGAAKTPAEINAWSDEMEAANPMKDPERRAHFMDHCSRLMLNPQTNTMFDLLEADDRGSFFRKPSRLANASGPNLAETLQTPVFPQTLHHLRPPSAQTNPSANSRKRKGAFSKSRDLREDRGRRQMKTTRDSQTFPHAR